MILEYELNIIKRELETHGTRYIVRREVLDEYGESTGEYADIKVVQGLYHIEKGYVTRQRSDGATVAGKGQPKLLILFDDMEGISKGDVINRWQKRNRCYIVNDIDNVGGLGIVCDLSLEVRQWE